MIYVFSICKNKIPQNLLGELSKFSETPTRNTIHKTFMSSKHKSCKHFFGLIENNDDQSR